MSFDLADRDIAVSLDAVPGACSHGSSFVSKPEGFVNRLLLSRRWNEC